MAKQAKYGATSDDILEDDGLQFPNFKRKPQQVPVKEASQQEPDVRNDNGAVFSAADRKKSQ